MTLSSYFSLHQSDGQALLTLFPWWIGRGQKSRKWSNGCGEERILWKKKKHNESIIISQDLSRVFSSVSPQWYVSCAGHRGLRCDKEAINRYSLFLCFHLFTGPLFELILPGVSAVTDVLLSHHIWRVALHSKLKLSLLVLVLLSRTSRLGAFLCKVLSE